MIRFIAILAALITSVAALHLVPGLDGSPIELNIRNSLHVIGFAAVTAIMFRAIPSSTFGKFAAAFGFALFLGVVSEAIQIIVREGSGNDFMRAFAADSVPDLVRDVSGSMLMLLAIVSATMSARIAGRTPVSIALKITSACLGAIVFLPLLFWLNVLFSERAKEPLLIDPDGRWTSMMLTSINAELSLPSQAEGSDKGSGYLQVILSRRPRSGVAVTPTFYDWSGYSSLIFKASIDAAETSVLTVHVNDSKSMGRFADLEAATVTVAETEQSFCISLQAFADVGGRRSNMSSIRQFVFLARSRVEGGVLNIGEIALASASCQPGPAAAGIQALAGPDHGSVRRTAR